MANEIALLKELGIAKVPDLKTYAELIHLLIYLISFCENYEKYYYNVDKDLDLECEMYGEAAINKLMDLTGMEWAQIEKIVKRINIDG